MNLVQDCRKDERTLAIHIRTRSDGPYASRSFVKSETLRDISVLSLALHLAVPHGCTKASNARLDIEGTISKGIRD